MSDSILYKVRSGKPIKFWYFIRKYMGLVIPDSWYRIRLEQRLCRVPAVRIILISRNGSTITSSWTGSDRSRRRTGWLITKAGCIIRDLSANTGVTCSTRLIISTSTTLPVGFRLRSAGIIVRGMSISLPTILPL